VGVYLPAKRVGDLVFTAGQLPLIEGELFAKGLVVESADDRVLDGWIVDSGSVDLSTAQECAALAAINSIAAAATVVDLEELRGVVKVTGFVAAAPGFRSHPQVINGASEIYGAVFGHAGGHARSAVGVASLPLGAPVEVEAVFEVATR
jgi:enamine deaminase RidA (YjgF/YER057c/UK114 family)